jgi:putative ABC transport system substrate-binding protein
MQFDRLRRREFITLVGGGAVTWPLAAGAQQPAVPLVGFLNSASLESFSDRVRAFRQGLSEIGYIEGRNVAIEFRWADGRYDRLPELAADLIRRQVMVIAAGGPPAAHAAKLATSTIPVVFTTGDDPVKAGLVASFNRPGGNITGVHLFLAELEAKRLGLLRDLLPQLEVIAVLLNATSQSADIQSKGLQAAGRAAGLRIEIVNAGSEREIEAAFATLAQRQIGALIVGSDPFYFTQRARLAVLAAQYAIPAVYELREFPDAGGLMAYGTSITDGYRQAGAYVGRILKGEKPADMPVVQSTKFEFVINLKTAKALDLTFPPGLLAIADEVIE